MKRSILYYPNIEISDGDWLRKSLLYWDEINSIVPRSLENELFNNNYTLEYLLKENLYRPIYPQRVFNSNMYNEFKNEILTVMKKTESVKNHIKYNQDIMRMYNIHGEKIPRELMRILKEVSLISQNGDWMSTNTEFASVYMGLLAKYAALTDSEYTVIGSDDYRINQYIYPTVNSIDKKMHNLIPSANLILNVLPVPNENVSLKKIVGFKRKYRQELINYRKQITTIEKEISECEGTEEMKEKLISFKEMIEKETSETVKMLKSERIDVFFTSMKSVMSLKNPAVVGTLVSMSSADVISVPPLVSISGMGMSAIVEIGVNYRLHNKVVQEKIANNSFMYLYQARRKNVIRDY